MLLRGMVELQMLNRRLEFNCKCFRVIKDYYKTDEEPCNEKSRHEFAGGGGGGQGIDNGTCIDEFSSRRKV